MMSVKTWRSFLILVPVIVLGACSDDVKVARLPVGATVLAFGDSLTSGVGVNNTESYPAVLAEISGLKVVNAGVSGELTQEGLGRLPALLDQTSPNMLILIEGGNDILRGYNLASTRQNLASMIKAAQDKYIPVVLLGLPEKNLFSSCAPLYSELAEEYQLVFDCNLLSSLLKNTSYKSDAIHFNEAGYRLMAERIHELLLDSGAL